MDTLPDPGDTPGNTPANIPPPQPTGGISSKEKEEFGSGLEAPALKEVGREIPVSAEVGAAGLTLHPTTVPLPQSVKKMGVKPIGDVAVPSGVQAAALPLTDDQIAVGLHQGITTSWRWLAQWCARRLKQLHMIIKKVRYA